MTARTAQIFSNGNRSVGLLAELAECIRTEDSSLELERIWRSLRSLADETQNRSQAIEAETAQIAKAARAQAASRKVRARLSVLMARC